MYGLIIIGFVLLAVYFLVLRRNTNFIVYRFYSPSCKYCVESEPAWNEFVKQVESIAVPTFTAKKINMSGASKANKELNVKYGGSGQGVPYIVRVDTATDAYDVYQGNRTTNDMITWVLSPMSALSHKDSRSSTDLPS